MTDEEVQQYLDDNGYPPHVAAAGKQGLFDRYRKFVAEVENGYEYGLLDYRNDLDLRGVIEMLNLGADVADEDRRLSALLVNREVRVWESLGGQPFWDFGYPENTSGRLRADLRREGLWSET